MVSVPQYRIPGPVQPDDAGKRESSSAATSTQLPGPIMPPATVIMEVLHEYDAQDDDELSLRVGEKLMLLEDDYEFNDGWYRGRKLTGNAEGLFPGIYTTPSAVMHAPHTDFMRKNVAQQQQESSPEAGVQARVTGNPAAPSDPTPATFSPPLAISSSYNPPAPQNPPQPDHFLPRSGAQTPEDSNPIPTPPLSVGKISGPPTPDPTPHKSTADPPPTSSGEDRANNSYIRSPVVDDTLTDIDEAISEISKNKALRDRSRGKTSMPTHQENHNDLEEAITDSASEYSIPVPTADDFGSDEEDDAVSDHMYDLMNDVPYTKEDVAAWSPEEVAQYLHSRGLQADVCDKFEEQEVNGSILLELEMSHLKELEIGSFGKRFKVWKEIEQLNKNLKPSRSKSRMGDTRMSVSSFADSGLGRSRSSSVGTVLPRIRSQHNRPPSRNPLIAEEEPERMVRESSYPGLSVVSSRIASFEAPVSPGTHRLPPSNRHSLNPDHVSPTTALNSAIAGAAVLAAGGHQRIPSFDINWSIDKNVRSDSGTGVQAKHKTQSSDTNLTIDSGFSGSQPQTPHDRDRHYFSSCELSTSTSLREKRALHKKQSSTNDSLDPISGTTRRHSRIESTEELFKKTPLSASLAYHMDRHKRKSASFSGSITLSHDGSSAKSRKSVDFSLSSKRGNDEDSIGELIAHPFTGNGGAQEVPDSVISSKPPRPSDSGSVPSITVSQPTPNMNAYSSKSSKSKSKSRSKSKSKHKKLSSALERGIREITPTEAAANADYSGWIKKRGSTGVGAWKSRFFVLEGRRLSYFYSMSDTRERGLIDITSHKVLSGMEDRIVGIHAALAAATSPSHTPKSAKYQKSQPSPSASSPTLPQDENIPYPASSAASPLNPASSPSKNSSKPHHHHTKSWFVFKLVPPAPGAAKGVNFTPPRLHYFATETKDEGKKWMAAMMKATIDRDETQPVVTSYNAKTISLQKARELRARPPGLSRNALGIELGNGNREGDDADVEDVEDERELVRRKTDSELGIPALGVLT